MTAPTRSQAEYALATLIHCEEWRPITDPARIRAIRNQEDQ